MIKNFQSLLIWQRSRKLVKTIYQITTSFPTEEKFGLTNQLCRASVSVPSNIAEGCGRKHPKDFIRFLYIALGSLCEVETQLFLSEDLEFIDTQKSQAIRNEVVEIRRMVNSYIKSVNKKYFINE